MFSNIIKEKNAVPVARKCIIKYKKADPYTIYILPVTCMKKYTLNTTATEPPKW